MIRSVGVYIAEVRCDAVIVRKLRSKHSISMDEVRLAIQYPAAARTAWEDNVEHGRRLIALGQLADGRRVIAYLLPIPAWEPEPSTWVVKTARWV